LIGASVRRLRGGLQERRELQPAAKRADEPARVVKRPLDRLDPKPQHDRHRRGPLLRVEAFEEDEEA